MANYNFVVDSSFTPFSMQEMVMPLAMYKEAYEKDEERYLELQKQAGDFEYLSRTLPENSQARQIYENYANDLKAQAEDFSHNGLSMKNRRALTALRGRYQGEIGQLVKADETVRELIKLRRTQKAQDPSMIYAVDIPNIDDYLDGKMGNEFGISGTELYTRGAAAAKAASLRNVKVGDKGSTLGGYYRDWVNTKGYSAEKMAEFRENVSAIPELQQAVDAILKERGVLDNLTGVNLQRARQSVINGIIDGAVYEESHNPQRDLGKIDAATAQQLALTRRGQNINLAMNGMTYDDKTGTITYNVDKDPAAQKAAEIAKIKAAAKGNGKTSNSKYSTQVSDRIRLKWNGNDPAESDEDLEDVTIEGVDKDDLTHSGNITPYDNLPARIKTKVKKIIGNGDPDEYDIYYKPFKGGTFNDDEAELEIVPRKIIKTNNDDEASVAINFGEA